MGFMRRMVASMMDDMMDYVMRRMLTEPYTENLFAMLPILNKISFMNLVEAGMGRRKGSPSAVPWAVRSFSPTGISCCSTRCTCIASLHPATCGSTHEPPSGAGLTSRFTWTSPS